MLHRQVQFALTTIDVGDPDGGLRVLRVGIFDHQILFERRIGLIVVQQVLRQPAQRVHVFAVHLHGVGVGADCVFVILLLLIGEPERPPDLRGARRLGDRIERFHRPFGVALFVVQVGEIDYRLFGIGVGLTGGLELDFRLQQVFVERIEPAQQQVVLGVFRLEFDDGFVLLDGQAQHLIGLAAGALIAQRAQVNAAQQLARFKIVRVALDDILGLNHRVADSSGAHVEFGQRSVQEL